ncbi:hypothetical protein ACFW9I_37095 [[Kitasatospora] papulosa]|uniref:hypothetical protein n=1 Tax=[Kitasatospora] papulosa TaxID=1464011 RepID=UPI0036B951EA
MAALVEVGTHAVLDAEIAGCRTGEVTLAGRLARSCGPDQLVLADREFLSVPLWRSFVATGSTRSAGDPDRISFTDTLRAARRSVTTTPGVFSP